MTKKNYFLKKLKNWGPKILWKLNLKATWNSDSDSDNGQNLVSSEENKRS